MRKIICGILVILGISVIGIGVYLQLDSTKEKIEKKEEESFVFDRLNNFDSEEVCSTFESVSTFVTTGTYDKVNFIYPNCVHEYSLSHWIKYLKSEDENIRIDVKREKNNLKNYMNGKKTKMISDKNYEYHINYSYTDIQKLTTKNGVEVNFIEANYRSEIVEGYGTNYDIWYVAAKIDDSNILVFDITVKDKVLSFKSVEAMINSIKIEKEKAEFKNTKEEGSYQVGSIRQNKYKSYDHGYNFNLKFPKDYPEVDSYSSDYDESIFEYEDIDKSVYVSVRIELDNYRSFDDKMKSAHDISVKSYNEENEKYTNVKDTGIKKETINGKEVGYYIISYDYLLNNKITSSNYVASVFYEVEEGYYYELYIINKNEKVDTTFIGKYLEFTVEEY